MNTIPTIFNEKITAYTAVGGKQRSGSAGISAVILNRPGPPRRSIFSDLENSGFDNVISIESCSPHYDIEELTNRFPFVRFILPENQINQGEQINLAASEIESPLFYVMHSDMKIVAGGIAERMAERLIVTSKENEEDSEKKIGFKRLCTIPLILKSNYEILPTLIIPLTQQKKIRTHLTKPQNEGDLSVYPYNGIGIYDRQRFIATGGFDITIDHPYWQLMDFGFRAHLWGEEIAVNPHYKLSYDGELPRENYSIKNCYKRFYLKNLAPVFKRDYAHLPYHCFPSFLFKSGEDISAAWEEFKKVRRWVKINKYRWKSDVRSVTSKWDIDTAAFDSHSDDSFCITGE